MHQSWETNAALWMQAVRGQAIASRRLATDKAVVEAILRAKPRRLLDLGCGEGWLCRALLGRVPERVGVDASGPLIESARQAGGAEFFQASYAEIAGGALGALAPFDAVVANFALLDQELQPLLRALRDLAKPGGALIVQTLHPGSVAGPYENGWREENFASFEGGQNWTPMPWFFRTTGSWLNEIAQAWRIALVEEPVNPATGAPASLLVTAENN